MARVTVNSGICGFNTSITAKSEDMQHAALRIETACPNLKPLEAASLEIDAYLECFSKIGVSSAFEFVRGHCKHPACPVASGMIKAVEVACGLALPKDASIHFEDDR